MKRTHYCGNISNKDIGQRVIIAGWVNRIRDLGNLCFIELRDREGFIQVTFNPKNNFELFSKAKELNNEYVVMIEGLVAKRSLENINPNYPTGDIEIIADRLVILNEAKFPPFAIMDDIEVTDNVRMRYRYIDLRRRRMLKNLRLRSNITFAIREFLIKEGFLEVETPILTKSTPEGARDYLVPSRIHKGKMYALPQSPQLFKQLLMVGGIDKYFQIPKCFRDEDLRADRQPEFTQVDIEMSFIEEEDIYDLIERLFKHVGYYLNVNIDIPFKRLKYKEAMELYGTDKPDLRFDCKIINLTEVLKDIDFKIFKESIEKGGVIIGIKANGCSTYSRKQLGDVENYVKSLGAAGLIWVKREGNDFKSPISKYLSEVVRDKIKERVNLEESDMLFIIAGSREGSYEQMGQLRLYLAQREGWVNNDQLSFVWVTDFPLFEYNEEERRWVSKHHPFTSPKVSDIHLLESEPWRVYARAYDIVLNGYEIGGGSIRIHDAKLQRQIFSVLNLTNEEVERKFGFFIEALQYGAPPHGGIALGLDRIVMIFAKEESIRDVIPFPKTTKAQCLLTQSPSEVSTQQLKELGMKLDVDENN